MVDPPPQALECLDKLGISSRMIDSIILTHCHSDHDTGTFRKLLFDQHIAVYTTKTIFNSFLRKYSAVTGFSKDFLSKLLVFKPALIGQDHFIHGGKFNFFYSLHTIPCVGFTVELDGKKIAYSADTHNSQELFDKMYKDNVIGKGRMEQLGSFNWDADVILHEAGVPPIHTPMQNLVTLPENVKKNLYVVHVAKKDVPKDCGLSTVEQGETISIPTKVSDLNASIEVLDVLKSVDIFREVCQTFPDAVEILYLISQEEFKPGERIVKAGDPGGKFYIITKGTAIVSWEFNGVKKHKQFYVGDYFGETSIVTGAPRNADVHAICHVRAASISTQHFEHLIAGTGIRDKLLALANVRNADSWHLIMKNSITRSLTSTAKTHLEFIMQSHRFEKDEVVWDIGDPAMFVLMIQTGKFHIECCKTTLRTREINISIFIDDHGALQICNGLLPDVAPHNQLNVRTQDVGFRIDGLKTEGSVTTGAILSDFDAIYTEHAVASRVVCQEEGIAFKISSSDWKKFCSHFPGAFVFFLNRHMAE
uniref:Cyclic nucleotide-binding domain-containing protein n=1 Tax=Mucochytrium quahogii TaxID=96639 RepID=A0A7S2RFZ1_9STRA